LFTYINVSQGSEATYARCGRIFNKDLREIYQGIFHQKIFISAKI